MWNYEKRLQFPVNIKEPNAKLAQVIISQYGGPDGEMGASMRYLSQRYSMPYKEVAGLLTDIGTEEFVHRCCTLNLYIKLNRNIRIRIHPAAMAYWQFICPLFLLGISIGAWSGVCYFLYCSFKQDVLFCS